MNFFKNSCVKHNQILLGTLLSDLYFDTKYSYMYVQEISSLLHQQPPKKKSGKKKGKKKSAKSKTPTIVDGISTEEMSKEQLEEHIVRLREELDREREERNYFQLERDKVNTFWEITKRQLEERKAELRNKDREMEEAEERHQVEIKVYKQKVKHLLYEHQNNIAELKAESKQLKIHIKSSSLRDSQNQNIICFKL